MQNVRKKLQSFLFDYKSSCGQTTYFAITNYCKVWKIGSQSLPLSLCCPGKMIEFKLQMYSNIYDLKKKPQELIYIVILVINLQE